MPEALLAVVPEIAEAGGAAAAEGGAAATAGATEAGAAEAGGGAARALGGMKPWAHADAPIPGLEIGNISGVKPPVAPEALGGGGEAAPGGGGGVWRKVGQAMPKPVRYGPKPLPHSQQPQQRPQQPPGDPEQALNATHSVLSNPQFG